MKHYYFKIVCITLLIISCDSNDNTTEETVKFSLEKAEKNLEWTAYKTTEKVPVTGTFKTINITSKAEGNTILEALDKATFSLPVEAILASGKEYNIINFFFGVMPSPEFITGTFRIKNEQSSYIELNMGGTTNNLPITYTIANNTVTISASMDLQNWDTQNAIASLNNACSLMHAGGDGIVKLWDTVNIRSTISF